MTLLPVHIVAGLTSIVSGYVAIFALKGATLHRRSGIIFVYAMLVLSASGATIGMLKSQRLNAVQGLLTFYLVATALLTVRRRAEASRWIDIGAMIAGLALALYEIGLGFEGLNAVKGTVDGIPFPLIFIFASVATLAVLGDLRMVMAGGIQGSRRIARHLWRMCYALFVASGSFFLGQAQVFPKPIRIFPLLAIPAFLPLILLAYWMVKVLFTKWYRRRFGAQLPPVVPA
jgi:uncharacterized membrane protein